MGDHQADLTEARAVSIMGGRSGGAEPTAAKLGRCARRCRRRDPGGARVRPPNETNSMFTSMEGAWDEVMAVATPAEDSPFR
ncbi:MAG: hypothetical protein ACSLE6_06870 [Mycobacterium sp.]